MSDADEWQKSETRRRAGPTRDGARSNPERDTEQEGHLTPKQVERIEEDVREEVAATDPAISDS